MEENEEVLFLKKGHKAFIAMYRGKTEKPHFMSWMQIVDICLATRPLNGGLISLEELCNVQGQRRKSSREAVSQDDCLRAISKLKTSNITCIWTVLFTDISTLFPVLGNGFEVISLGKKKLVRSVPTELNNEILELAQGLGYVPVDEIQRRLSWSSGRATDALETLLEEGLAMIDDGHMDGRRRYWFPCVSSVSSFAVMDAV
ncbi:vacuolar protein sorting-associated protein 22 homolog 1-like [Primulina tabacum]|uniref:vacuolar protein sorting-associated protein 22 homolog 1-like n=1 Tax=Primulina tabacum TaxID=48773 RepID=UPI003F592109